RNLLAGHRAARRDRRLRRRRRGCGGTVRPAELHRAPVPGQRHEAQMQVAPTGRTGPHRSVRPLVALLLACAIPRPALAAPGPAACMRGSGNTGTDCLRDYVDTIEACQLSADAPCEAA